MKHTTLALSSLALIATLASCGKSGSSSSSSASGPQEEVKIAFPNPMFIGTPTETKLPNLETPDPSKVIKTFMAPKGTVNVAKGKKVTSSDAAPIIGDLTLVTDGDADGADGNFVELAPGHHWIQIDLETSHRIRKIALWHYHKQAGAYLDVCVQASDDPEFKKGVVTLFNNDHDNSSGLGFGKDPAYIETNHGRVIDGKAVKARYIRLYSNGNTTSDMNHYCEVQVFAVPAAGAAPAPAK
ncbi:MAG: discoidin domain-containing protein [Verrucomicrobiaceae bacterium]|nr:discoidin domain-containing protein [Verrucomicrobiaceae bacterium]